MKPRMITSSFLFAILIAILGCNTADLERLTETDNVRFFNKLIATRNAVWATPLNNETDLIRAKAKIIDAKDLAADNVDPKLLELRDELVRLSDRKLDIVSQIQATSKDIDDFNAAGLLEKIATRTRVDKKARDAQQLADEFKSLASSLDQWDIQLESTRIALGLGHKKHHD